MAKQKSGLHKEVGAIFDGIPNPNELNGNATAQQVVAPPTGSYFRPDGIGMNNEDVSHTPQPMPKKSSIAAPPQMPTVPAVKPQEKSPVRSVMLPASLTTRPSTKKLLDKIKLKLAELEEKGGRRQVVSAILIPVLAVFLIAVLWVNLAPAPKPKAKNNTNTNVSVSNSAANGKINWPTVKPFPSTLRDPMSAHSTAAADGGAELSPENIKVNGILYDVENPELSKAIINGMQAKVGDVISGVKIVKIAEKYVELEKNGEIKQRYVGF